jgi:hypothetical protein
MVCTGTEVYLEMNGVKIARRGAPGTPQARTWVSLEPGYRVLDKKNKRGRITELVVEHNGVRVQ